MGSLALGHQETSAASILGQDAFLVEQVRQVHYRQHVSTRIQATIKHGYFMKRL